MKASPVRRYRLPAYPAKQEVQHNPGLLRRNIPPPWRALPEMTGAVALFLSLTAVSCRPGEKKGSAVAVVAPIFEHGVGRGSTGCIVVAPPVFMSEEEALQVVREELSKARVEINQQGYTVKGAHVPLAEYFEENNKTIIRPREKVKERKSFEADAGDPKKKIAVEFISENDFNARCGHTVKTGNGGFSISTVHDYQIKNLAGFVAEQVKKEGKEKIYFGTFYDPVADRRDYGRGFDLRQQPVESKRLLRLQVQDFVKWLQAQGAI